MPPGYYAIMMTVVAAVAQSLYCTLHIAGGPWIYRYSDTFFLHICPPFDRSLPYK